MKQLLLSIITIGLAVIINGCAPDILNLPVTNRDQQCYNNKFAKDYQDNGQQKALKVAIVPQDPNLKGRDRRTLKTLKSLTNTFGDGLETAFSNLADFEVVPRSEIAAIVADKSLVGMTSDKVPDYKIKNVNFMLIYRVSSYNFKKATSLLSLGSKKSKPSYNAYVKVKVSLVNLRENVKEFTKTISGKSSGNSDKQSIELLNSAVENAIKDFITQFAVDYAPPAIVQQTKGCGQVALLNMGKNYGLMKNMKVEFFVFKVKNGKRLILPFAYGKIIEVGKDSAWAEVDNYETAGVMENHFVQVRKDQSKSFLESITEK